MSELGQLLKKTRMEKGISLDDLQEATKIQKRYLVAIEEGNYKILPGSFYVRAFIKSYAEEVGLDPSEVLRMYQNVIPSPHPDQTIEPIRKKRASSRNTDAMNRWISSIVLWSFIILIAGIIYYFYYTHSSGNEKVLDNDDYRITDQADSGVDPLEENTDKELHNESQPDPLAEMPQEEETPPPPDPVVKFAKSENGVDYYELEFTESVNLELEVIGDQCWIQVTELVGNERKKLEEVTISRGDVRSYEVNNSVYLYIGRASALQIKVNGEPIPAGELPNPKRFQFDLPSV